MKCMSKFFALIALLWASNTFALDQIIYPYYDVRTAGMGGVFLTTGLYDQNFFGNPARVTANPGFKLTLFDPTIEANSGMISNAPKIINTATSGGGTSNIINLLSGLSGSDLHGRIELVAPAVYFNVKKLYFGIGILTSEQLDLDPRNNYSVGTQSYLDISPAVTVGYKFLKDDALSIGTTIHESIRASTPASMDLGQFLGGGFSLSNFLKDGMDTDFDVGATYNLPWKVWNTTFTTGAAVNNVLGGTYSSPLPVKLGSITGPPLAQPTSIGVGISAVRPSFWKFAQTTAALEFTDFGNNAYGSLFRQIHLGAETNWGILAFRGGINQGYWTAGLGINLYVLTIDLASYGEEMGLNAGDIEDRRYMARIALQI